MTLAQQVGQLLHIGFDGLAAPDRLLRRVRASEVGGVIQFGRNIESPEQLTELNQRLAAAAPADAPLILAVDQEGGRVQRVRAPATVWPPMDRLGALPEARGLELARAVGRALGAELAAMGFNMDYAPVLDVHTNPANPVIGDRALSTDPARVAALGIELARGLTEGGCLPCGKHFPGHGDTLTDSHHELPFVGAARQRLDAVELYPFAAAVRAGVVPMLMTAHVVFEALDPGVPATLSERILGGLLRGAMGFEGVIASDDLEMKAIAGRYGAVDAALRALRAGCDVLLVCSNPWQGEASETLQRDVFEGIVRAAEADSGLRARIGESAARVARMKAALPRRAAVSAAHVRQHLGTAEHQALAAALRA